MKSRLMLPVAALLLLSQTIVAQTTTVQYLANEGVMVSDGDSKILFDPLFNNGYGRYQLVPAPMREAIFAGEAPYDDVDAVFISHHHGDHFSAEDMLRLLQLQAEVRLYGPMQAVTAVREIAGPDDSGALDRMTGLDLEYGDEPVRIETDGLAIFAAYIPHSGWPTARTDVQNIAFRVTLGDDSTVLHLGDADARVVHFNTGAESWESRTIDLALPPYWFFASDDGVDILENRLDVIKAIGIHVPDEFADPARLPAELRQFDLFTRPGEGRRF